MHGIASNRRNSIHHVKFVTSAETEDTHNNIKDGGEVSYEYLESTLYCPITAYFGTGEFESLIWLIHSTQENELAWKWELKLASTYVENALQGQHIDFDLTEKNLRLYWQYHRPIARWVLCAVLLCHLSLAALEQPALPGCHVPEWASLSIEFCFLLFYTWRLHTAATFTPRSAFRKDPKHIVLGVTLGLIFVDMVVFVGLRSSGLRAVRWSRILRPVLCACWSELRGVRVALRTLRRALPAVAHVAALYCALLATAALIAYKMLGHKHLHMVSGRPYFSTYWDSLFDLYVLVTTANHPDIMMPAFDLHVVYVSFFTAFLVMCYFIYMNVVLAVIYNSYKRHLKAEVLHSCLGQQRQLQRAFDVLSRAPHGGGARVVCMGRFQQLMLSLPGRRSPALAAVLFAVLDSSNTGSLERAEFLRVAELLSVHVSEVQPSSSCSRAFTRTLPRTARAITALVNSRWFQHVFDGLTVMNAIVIGCSGENAWWDRPLEWVFLTAFLLEIALKITTLGVVRFFCRAWNTFDFLVIGSAFLIGLVEVMLGEARQERLSLDVLLLLRVLRLVRVAGSVRSFRTVVLTLAKILPSLRTYGSVILLFYYVFAIAGLELFSGLVTATSNRTVPVPPAPDIPAVDTDRSNINSSQYYKEFPLYCGNSRLAGTDYWRARYCNNNFNDVLHAYIVLFELTVVNQWHVLAYGFAALTHSSARLYFLLFHLLCVTLLLNVFTAFVLEVFLLEYSASEEVLESQLEAKILKLGLSATRRRRKSSTLSHDELVLQDSSDEDDTYSFGKGTNQDAQPGPGEGDAAPGVEEAAIEGHRKRNEGDGNAAEGRVEDTTQEQSLKSNNPIEEKKLSSDVGSNNLFEDGKNADKMKDKNEKGADSEANSDATCSTLHRSPSTRADPVAPCCCNAAAATAALLDTSVRFHLSKSVCSVEVLLQRLFRKELLKADSTQQLQLDGKQQQQYCSVKE